MDLDLTEEELKVGPREFRVDGWWSKKKAVQGLDFPRKT